MSAPAFQRVLEYPCRLAFGCTDLTAAWPHGGTGLGFTDLVVVTLSAPVHVIQAQELPGASAIDAVACGEGWSMTFVLRDADPDAYTRFFLNTSTGTVSQRPKVVSPSTNRAGYSLSSRATVLVVTPETVVNGFEDQHDLVVFYRALPHVQATADLEHRLGRERGIPLAVVGIPNASGKAVEMGRLRDLTAVS